MSLVILLMADLQMAFFMYKDVIVVSLLKKGCLCYSELHNL